MSHKRVMSVVVVALAIVMVFAGSADAAKGGKPGKPPPEPSPEPPANPEIAHVMYGQKGKEKHVEFLSIMNADGSNVHRLVADCFSPSWSPDGTMFVCRDYTYSAGGSKLLLCGLDGSCTSSVIDPIRAGGPTEWSPDGSHIVYVRHALPRWNLAAVNVTGGSGEVYAFSGEPYDVAVTPVDGYYDSPAWSPDGSRIAANWSPREGEDQRDRIVVLAVATEPSGNLVVQQIEEKLVQDNATLYRATDWSRTGNVLAVRATVDGLRGVYTYDLDNPAAGLKLIAADMGSPTWSPDDSALAMNLSGGIFVYDMDTHVLEMVGLGKGPDWRRCATDPDSGVCTIPAP